MATSISFSLGPLVGGLNNTTTVKAVELEQGRTLEWARANELKKS